MHQRIRIDQPTMRRDFDERAALFPDAVTALYPRNVAAPIFAIQTWTDWLEIFKPNALD
jgi:hypothetical protein